MHDILICLFLVAMVLTPAWVAMQSGQDSDDSDDESGDGFHKRHKDR